jgi:hypothetical protein
MSPVVLHNPTELAGWPIGARSVSTTVATKSKVIWIFTANVFFPIDSRFKKRKIPFGFGVDE